MRCLCTGSPRSQSAPDAQDAALSGTGGLWVYRRTQWIALVTADLALTVEQIIEFYGARWKIEAGFRETKQEIGSSQSQTRNAFAVTNHLQFCMMATTLVWIYADRISHTPARRYITKTSVSLAVPMITGLTTPFATIPCATTKYHEITAEHNCESFPNITESGDIKTLPLPACTELERICGALGHIGERRLSIEVDSVWRNVVKTCTA